tara:strand:- start:2780 stop:4039 length:1260 start_codon:yes stop_codon:yes gene_type:complete
MHQEFDLSQELVKLLHDEPFYAALSRRMDKRLVTTIPTAGVRLNPQTESFELVVNPKFFEELPQPQRKGILFHEFWHIILGHVTGRIPDGVNFKAWNIATDLAINSLLTKAGKQRDLLPENCCLPGEGPFEKYPHGLSAEKYLKMLKEDAQSESENNEDGEGDGSEGNSSGGGQDGDSDQQGQGGAGGAEPLDDHSGWEESEGSSTAAEIAKEKMKDVMKQAAEEAAAGRGFGSCEGKAKKIIIDSIKTKVDWKKVLRSFVNTSVRANRRHTIKRINKRFPYIHAGTKVKREAKIAVCIDQSGSVDDTMLVKFYAELNKLCDLVSFDIIPFDSSVGEKHIYTWKKGQKRNWERVMFGGTCFDAPTKYVNENKYDGMVVLTDMLAPKPKRANCKRLWMTTAEYADRPYFNPAPERMIVVD